MELVADRRDIIVYNWTKMELNESPNDQPIQERKG